MLTPSDQWSVITAGEKIILKCCYGNVCFLQVRQFQTSTVQRDIDQAAKYIGAGAATVGVAGSGV
jgi:hypothetical protein